MKILEFILIISLIKLIKPFQYDAIFDFNGPRRCKNITTCDCLQPIDPSLPIEIHCPDFSDDQMQLYYRINTSLIVQCLPPLHWNPQEDQIEFGNISYLDRVQLGQVVDMKISHCNLTQSDHYLHMLLTSASPKYISLRSNIVQHNLLILASEEHRYKYDSVETLNMENNNLKEIPYELLGIMKNLKHISFNFNKITAVTHKFEHNLYSLQLAENDITYIEEHAFQNLTNLISLHLWRNNITEIHSTYFKHLTSLEILELSQNFIAILPIDIFNSLPALRFINLEGNLLEKIPDNVFKSNNNLESIRIARNKRLFEIPDSLFANFKHLRNIRANSCNLKRISQNMFKNSPNIEIIYLNQNNLEELDDNVFKDLKRLEILNLADNKLRKVSIHLFQDLVKLEDLDLSGNLLQITSSEILQHIKNNNLSLLNNSTKILRK